jgi:pimeloyl-ACP methyl ester carboxylesterase
MVAYAFARRAPERVRGVLLLESPLAGIEPWNELKADPGLWHFGFHQTPNLPEELLAGREYIYLRKGFLTSERISDAKVRRYAAAYAAPDHLRAGLEYYRAFPKSEPFLDQQRQFEASRAAADRRTVFGTPLDPEVVTATAVGSAGSSSVGPSSAGSGWIRSSGPRSANAGPLPFRAARRAVIRSEIASLPLVRVGVRSRAVGPLVTVPG